MITPVYTTPAGSYLKALLGRYLIRKRWMAYPAIVAFALAAVLSDLRWAIVAFMWICIVIPGLLTIVVLDMMASPQYRRASLPRRVEVEPGSHVAVFYPENPELESERIEWSRVRRVTPRRITLRNPFGIILLPQASAAPEGEGEQPCGGQQEHNQR